MGPEDLPAWLSGTWSIDRSINATDRFAGTAVFSPAADGRLRWSEQGQVTLGGHRGPASRELTLAPAQPAGTWQVLFDDGRLFHELDLEGGRCTARHDCGADVYLGEYVVSYPDTLTVRWRVSGPERDDTIHSVYERL